MNIKPISDRIIIKSINKESKTDAGILIPKSAKEVPTMGYIVAVGSGRVDNNGEIIIPEVKVGDKVIYTKYSGIDVEIDNKKFLIMRESDILAIIREE